MSSSSEGDSKGDTTDSKEAEHRSNSVKQQGISNLDSSPPPQSVILPGYYPAQFSRQQAGFTSPEISYYYQQQQSYRASVPSSTTSSAVESTQRRESPVYFGRGYHPQQQAYGGAPGRIYEASGSDSGGTHPRGVASEVELGVGVVAGAAAAAASMLYQTSYPGAKVNYSPSYPTVGGSSSQTGYPEGLSRRLTPPQQTLYQQAASLPHVHGVPSVYTPYAAAQGSVGYISGPERHPGLIPLDDPSTSLDSNAPIEGLSDRISSTPGSYYRTSAAPSAVEAARALGAPSGGSFYPQQSASWYGIPDPYQPGIASSQLGYSDSPLGAYMSYQGATFPNPGPPIQTTPFNKGPEGANLFVFHIPNDMTNQTMYEMFAPFGNLLSVRIMVEKDTGRSRGFGFVSYDSPESAAAAIKALNGHIVSLPLICNPAILTAILYRHFNRLLADLNFLGSTKNVFDERLVIND